MKKYLLTMFLFVSLPVFAQKKLIHPPEFPADTPFTPGVLVGGTLYIAGQTGYDLKTGRMPVKFDEQLRQTLDKIGLILKAAGMAYSDVVSVTVYLTDINLAAQMGDTWSSYFKTNPPARVVVGVSGLVRGATVAVAAVAAR